MYRQKSFENESATLYLVATPIGNLSELSERAKMVLEEVDVIAAEDTRNTKKLLQHFGIHTHLITHHLHNEKESAKGLIKLLEEGKDIALVSDAGYPLLNDPGQTLVTMVIHEGYNVVPISGANAALNALVASGLSAMPFLFYGFLDAKSNERIKALQAIKNYPQTIIFYEAPHRIEKMLEDCLDVLGNRKMCLARELTKKHEEFIRGTISEVLDIVDTLKGEMVVVIEGAKQEEKTLSIQDLNLKVDHFIENGMSTKEAIKTIAKEYGLSKNELYKKYHEYQTMKDA